MGTFSNEFVTQIYNLPKTQGAVSEFLNSTYEEVQPNGKIKVRQMWERFEAAYVKVTRHYVRGTDDDEGDIYLYAHKLISRCVLSPVAPYFESDGQLFAYFQLMVKNTRINNSIKEDKQSFLLIDDLISRENVKDDDYSNFEEMVLSSGTSQDLSKSRLDDVLDIINELGDSDLILFGHLFVVNNFSFDEMYGMCGYDLKTFKDLKKRFIAELKKVYGK